MKEIDLNKFYSKKGEKIKNSKDRTDMYSWQDAQEEVEKKEESLGFEFLPSMKYEIVKMSESEKENVKNRILELSGWEEKRRGNYSDEEKKSLWLLEARRKIGDMAEKVGLKRYDYGYGEAAQIFFALDDKRWQDLFLELKKEIALDFYVENEYEYEVGNDYKMDDLALSYLSILKLKAQIESPEEIWKEYSSISFASSSIKSKVGFGMARYFLEKGMESEARKFNGYFSEENLRFDMLVAETNFLKNGDPEELKSRLASFEKGFMVCCSNYDFDLSAKLLDYYIDLKLLTANKHWDFDWIDEIDEYWSRKNDVKNYFYSSVVRKMAEKNLEKDACVYLKNISSEKLAIEACLSLAESLAKKGENKEAIAILNKAKKINLKDDLFYRVMIKIQLIDCQINIGQIDNTTVSMAKINLDDKLKDMPAREDFICRAKIAKILAKIGDNEWREQMRLALEKVYDYMDDYNEEDDYDQYGQHLYLKEVVEEVVDVSEYNFGEALDFISNDERALGVFSLSLLSRGNLNGAILATEKMRWNLKKAELFIYIAKIQAKNNDDTCYKSLLRACELDANRDLVADFLDCQFEIDPEMAMRSVISVKKTDFIYLSSTKWSSVLEKMAVFSKQDFSLLPTETKINILKKASDENDKEVLRIIGSSILPEEREVVLKFFDKEVMAIVDCEILKRKNIEAGQIDNLAEYYGSMMKIFLRYEENDKELAKNIGQIFLEIEKQIEDDPQRIAQLIYSVAGEMKADHVLFPRFIKILADLDNHNAQRMVFYLAGRIKDDSDRIFCYAMEKLIEKKFLSPIVKNFIYEQRADYGSPEKGLVGGSLKDLLLSDRPVIYRRFADKENIGVLKEIIKRYPSKFISILETIVEIPDYSLAKNKEEVFSALEYLGSVTPLIFDRFRRLSEKSEGNELDEKRRHFAENLNKLKFDFFGNKPISQIFEEEEQDILEEMIYLAYDPVEMSFNRMSELLSGMNDSRSEKERIEDLAGFSFPENGYELDFYPKEEKNLKAGEEISKEKIDLYLSLFAPVARDDTEKKKMFFSALQKMTKGNLVDYGRGGGGSNEGSSAMDYSFIKAALNIAVDKERIKDFQNRHASGKLKLFSFLNELNENLTIYLRDNYWKMLTEFLSENQDLKNSLVKTLESSKSSLFWNTLKGERIKRNKAGKKGEFDFSLDEAQKRISEDEVLAKMLAEYLQNELLKHFKISKEIEKFEGVKKNENISFSNDYRAYVSKNNASFFAKASAGICTAEDLDLYNWKNHFHINIVENKTIVQGNIQAYIIDFPKEKKSLLLRGFNPNIKFLDRINAGVFCEEIIRIGKKFKEDNNLEHLYIVDQMGGFHALSNREEIGVYLARYTGGYRSREASIPIIDKKETEVIYEVA